MAGFSKEQDRKIIPRWRTYSTTRRTREVGSVLPPPTRRQVTSELLESKISAWQRHRTVGHASDLVGAGLALGASEFVVEPAKFLLREDLSVTTWAQELAKRALGAPEIVDASIDPEPVEKSNLHARIRTFRESLRVEPRDPITWVDLSRCYACLGQQEHAKRSMIIALQLAKDNRFVVRAASRLWVNLDDPERAHATIIASDRSRHDPWLLAAEIAVGSIANKPPKRVKIARQMLSRRQYSPAHLTELASAVATLELDSGTRQEIQEIVQAIFGGSD